MKGLASGPAMESSAPRSLPPSSSAAVVFAAAILLLPCLARATDLSEAARRAKPAVVHLRILNGGKLKGEATGFFISPDGLIATNHHVLESAADSTVEAHLADGTVHRVSGFLAEDATHDLAILQAEGRGFPALPLGDSDKVKEGLKVATWGSPMGLSFTLAEGIISAIRPGGLPAELPSTEQASRYSGPIIQINASGAQGSSGSPIFDEDGQVIGVIHSGMGTQGTIMFGVPSNRLASLRATIPEDARPRAFGTFPWLNVLISALVWGGVAGWFWRERLQRLLQPTRLKTT